MPFRPHAIECLGAGRHVLVEKPVLGDFGALSAAQREASAKHGRHIVVAVGFQRRFDAEYLRCRQAVDELLKASAFFCSDTPVERSPEPGSCCCDASPATETARAAAV